MKKKFIRAIALILAILMLAGIIGSAIANAAAWTDDVYAYGAGLSDSQIKSTAKFLGVPSEKTPKIVINGADAEKYLNEESSDAGMISSIYIKKNNSRTVNVEVITPLTIQSVSSLQYANAAITAGVTGLDINVASVIPVSGTSALTGVYKSLENLGIELDTKRTEAANEEIEVINEIADSHKNEEDFSKSKLNKAILEGKKEIVDIKESDGNISAERIDTIIQNIIKNNELNTVLTNVDIGNINIILQNFSNITNNNTFNINEVKIQLQNLVNNSEEIAKKELDKVQEFLKTDEGKDYIESIKDQLTPEQVNGLLENTKNSLDSKQIESVLDRVKDNISSEKLNDLVNSAKEKLSLNSDTFSNVGEKAGGFFSSIEKFLGDIFNSIGNFFENIFN